CRKRVRGEWCRACNSTEDHKPAWGSDLGRLETGRRRDFLLYAPVLKAAVPLKKMLIDTHCHLDYIPFSPRLPEILTSASHCGVGRFIVPGVEPQSWERIISLSREDERIFAAPGVHPMHADRWNAAAADFLQRLVPEIVAVGEIGLDYYEETPPRFLQQEVFRLQLRMALKADLPVIIHCRKAFNDLLRILDEESAGAVQGVMHAFSGSVEIARECIVLGLKIGIAGPVTWRNAVRPLKVVKE